MIREIKESNPYSQGTTFRYQYSGSEDNIPRMPQTFSDRVKSLINKSNYSVRSAAIAAGLNESTLRKLLANPDQAPAYETLTAVAALFDVSESWLLGKEHNQSGLEPPQSATNRFFNVDPIVTPQDVPLMGTASGSHVKGSFCITSGPVDLVRRPPALSATKNLYALIVDGNSMYPKHPHGQLIYVNPNKPYKADDSVIIQTTNGHGEVEATCGEYIKKDEKYIYIKKFNPLAEVKILLSTVEAVHKVMTTNELMGV